MTATWLTQWLTD